MFAFAGYSTVTRLVDGIQLEDKFIKFMVLYVEENTVKFIALNIKAGFKCARKGK